MRARPFLFVFVIAVSCAALIGCDSDDDGGGGASSQNGDTTADVQDTSDVVATDKGTDPETAPDSSDTNPGDTGTTPDVVEVTPEVEEVTPVEVDPHCAALVEGNNVAFMVDGVERSFMLGLPERSTLAGPWPVVFNWHGFGDSAANMHGFLKWNVNDETYPFILVTPEDTGLMPPAGMDWNILKVTDGPGTKEARLFDEVLTCIDQVYGVDWDRVHVVGFSAGSIMADLLGVVRGDVIASLATFSGVYFSNTPNKDALGAIGGLITWPEMTTENTYSQLLIHGGPTDNYNLSITTLQFNESGERDVEYLRGRGHDIIHCNHGGGHTIPNTMGPWNAVRFLEAHPKGGKLTWTSLDGDWPEYCSLKPAN